MKQTKSILAVVLALTAALFLAACAQQNQATSSSQATSSTETATTQETGEYTGKLTAALTQAMRLNGDKGNMDFATNSKTVYDLGGLDHMCINDVMRVTYHTVNNHNYADKVTLVEHVEEALHFKGTVTAVTDTSVTVSSKSMTITFSKDAKTNVVGDLSVGDEVDITYVGNISEHPYARSIHITVDNKKPQTSIINGIISELTNGTLLLGVDSAHAYRFTITANTKITGADTKLGVGDSVQVTYEGDVVNTPAAISVNIVKKAQANVHTINGTIAKVEDGALTLETGKATYVFVTTKDTKYTGEKPTQGYKAEIAYTGDLANKPTAAIVYCVKSEQDAKKQAVDKDEKEKKKAEEQKKKESGKKDSDKKDKESDKKDKDSDKKDKQTSSSSSEAPAPAPAPDETSSSSSEAPAPEPDTSSSSSEAPEPEPAPDTSSSSSEAPAPEPEPAASSSSSEQSATSSEPKAADKPEPEVVIAGKATIIKGNDAKKTVELKMNDDTKVKLKIDDKTKIASGYFPKKDDVVKVKYDKTNMVLKEIQLIERKADQEADKEAA